MSDEQTKAELEEYKKLHWHYYDYDGSIYRSDMIIEMPFSSKMFQAKIEHWNKRSKTFEEPKGDTVKKILFDGDKFPAEQFWSEFFNE